MFAAYNQNDAGSGRVDSQSDTLIWLQNSSFVSVENTSKSANEIVSQPTEHPLKGVDELQSLAAHQYDEPSRSTSTDEGDRRTPAKKEKKAKKSKKEKKKLKKKKKSRDVTPSSPPGTRGGEKGMVDRRGPIPKTSPYHGHGGGTAAACQTMVSSDFRLQNEPAIYQDVKGDRSNLGFSTLYYKYVPRHYRMSGALGFPGYGRQKSAAKRARSLRYFDKRALKRLSMTSTPVTVKSEKTERNPLGVYDSQTVMYVQGHSSTASAQQDEAKFESEEDFFRRQTALFNEKLRHDQHNVQLWLSFVNFQDSTRFQFSQDGEDSLPKKQEKPKAKTLPTRALMERKISILDKAIALNPKSEELIAARLDAATHFWDVAALQQEWRKTVFVHPMSIKIWKKYLFFVESYFETFNTQSVLKSYAGCFEKLIQIQHPSFASHKKPAHLEAQLTDIFSGLCHFLRNAGLLEKSISFIQALMELCLKRSPLESLQTAWESRRPRMGEVGADSIRVTHGSDLSETEDEIVASGNSFPVVWHQLESVRCLEQWQAWTSEADKSTGEGDDCDDAERIVPFADVSPYLFICENEAAVQFRVVVGCLQSLGVPLFPACQAQLFWAPLSNSDSLMDCIANVPELVRLPSVEPTLMSSQHYLAFVRRIVSQCWQLLKDPYRLELAIWWLEVERLQVQAMARKTCKPEASRKWKETKSWIKNFLKGVATENCSTTFTLYNGYAAVEKDAGNPEESQRILQMVLHMNSSNPLTYQHTGQGTRAALVHSWFSYARGLLFGTDQPSRTAALAHLVALGTGSNFSPQAAQPTPASVLKAKRRYLTVLEDLSAPSSKECSSDLGLFNQPDETIDLLLCHAYFISLTEGCLAAYKVVEQWLASSEKKGLEFKPENRFDCAFIKYHAQREAVYFYLIELLSACREWTTDVQPNLHAATLRVALAEYPESVRLLTVLIESNEPCNMFSGLWKSLILRAKSVDDSGSLSALAACLALAQREETLRAAEERTLAEESKEGIVAILHQGYRRKIVCLIEHCVSHSPGRHVPVLWRVLMRDAHLRRDAQRCKALFYRAIRECPWSKDICMDVIDYVPISLKEVISLMQEKELRLRFPLEELEVLMEPEEAVMMADQEGDNHSRRSPPEGNNDHLSGSESEGNFSDDFETNDNVTDTED